MTKRDFELIAGVIRDLPNDVPTPVTGEELISVAVNFATALQRQNPRFDYARFLKACGVDNHVHA